MNALQIPTDALRCELEEMLLNTVEDTLDAPADLLTPLRLKVTEDGDGLVLTVLQFEVKIDA